MHIARYNSRREQAKFWLLNLVWLFDVVIIVATFGCVVSEYHAPILFSDWMDS
jgi:hypothetical protein